MSNLILCQTKIKNNMIIEISTQKWINQFQCRKNIIKNNNNFIKRLKIYLKKKKFDNIS